MGAYLRSGTPEPVACRGRPLTTWSPVPRPTWWNAGAGGVEATAPRSPPTWRPGWDRPVLHRRALPHAFSFGLLEREGRLAHGAPLRPDPGRPGVELLPGPRPAGPHGARRGLPRVRRPSAPGRPGPTRSTARRSCARSPRAEDAPADLPRPGLPPCPGCRPARGRRPGAGRGLRRRLGVVQIAERFPGHRVGIDLEPYSVELARRLIAEPAWPAAARPACRASTSSARTGPTTSPPASWSSTRSPRRSSRAFAAVAGR